MDKNDIRKLFSAIIFQAIKDLNGKDKELVDDADEFISSLRCRKMVEFLGLDYDVVKDRIIRGDYEKNRRKIK